MHFFHCVQGGNAWGNKNRQDSKQNPGPPTGNAPPPNFADSDAFGPPLGGRGRRGPRKYLSTCFGYELVLVTGFYTLIEISHLM